MKRNIVILGIIGLVVVIGFSFAACGGGAGNPPGGEEDYVITFGLTKINEKEFQIEIDGASWKPGLFNYGWLVKLDGIEFFKDPGGRQDQITEADDKYADDYFDQETTDGSRDPRKMKLDSQFAGVNGKITLKLDHPTNKPVDCIGTRPNKDLYTYRINPAKTSITFTYTE